MNIRTRSVALGAAAVGVGVCTAATVIVVLAWIGEFAEALLYTKSGTPVIDLFYFGYPPDTFRTFDVIFGFCISIAMLPIFWAICTIMFESYEFLGNYASSICLFLSLVGAVHLFVLEVFIFIDHFKGAGQFVREYRLTFVWLERLLTTSALFMALVAALLQINAVQSRISTEMIFFAPSRPAFGRARFWNLFELLFRRFRLRPPDADEGRVAP